MRFNLFESVECVKRNARELEYEQIYTCLGYESPGYIFLVGWGNRAFSDTWFRRDDDPPLRGFRKGRPTVGPSANTPVREEVYHEI